MSEFHVVVAELRDVQKHPNADTLDIGTVNGYPVTFRSGTFQNGDRVVHIPVDSVVPRSCLALDYLFEGTTAETVRIKARRIRGIFSMGVIIPAEHDVPVGTNLQQLLGITKHDPDLAKELEAERKAIQNWKRTHAHGTAVKFATQESGPSTILKYDIEGYRRYSDLIKPGELVWVTEKIHGQNARYMHDGNRLWVGSRNFFKQDLPGDTWWQVARDYDLEGKLATVPNIAIYGETYGNNADLHYGVKRPGNDRFVMFDALDTNTGRWCSPDEVHHLSGMLGIPHVPIFAKDEPWDPAMLEWAENDSKLANSNGAYHISEGIVIKPSTPRVEWGIGRVFLKHVSQNYLTRKGA